MVFGDLATRSKPDIAWPKKQISQADPEVMWIDSATVIEGARSTGRRLKVFQKTTTKKRAFYYKSLLKDQ